MSAEDSTKNAAEQPQQDVPYGSLAAAGITPAAEGAPQGEVKVPPTPPEIEGLNILHYIGHGGLGDVWLAEDLGHIWWAVKIPHASATERDLEAYQLYHHLANADSHGLIVAESIGKTKDGRLYYKMPLADDLHPQNRNPAIYETRTLQAAWEQNHRAGTKFSIDEVVHVGLAILAGLKSLHTDGLVHCDVKPVNILCIRHQWRLGDTGLLTRTKDLPVHYGTRGYMPPEGICDASADLYALAKTLYQVSTGKLTDFAEPAYESGLAKDSNLREQFGPLNRVILKACQLDPKLRYQRADEMLADLARPKPSLVATLPPISRPYGTKFRRGVGAALFAINVGVVAAAVWYFRTPPTTVPLEIQRFCVYLRESTDKPEAHQACLGEVNASFDRASSGQYAQVAIDLSQPAYFYVIAFNPDGKDQLFWPYSDKNGLPLEKTPPAKSSGLQHKYGFRLTDGVGVQVFALVASLDPLPCYSEWKRLHGSPPWSHVSTPGVWAYDGKAVQALNRGRNERGDVVEMNDPRPIEPLCTHLRTAAGKGVVRAIAFPVVAATEKVIAPTTSKPS